MRSRFLYPVVIGLSLYLWFKAGLWIYDLFEPNNIRWWVCLWAAVICLVFPIAIRVWRRGEKINLIHLALLALVICVEFEVRVDSELLNSIAPARTEIVPLTWVCPAKSEKWSAQLPLDPVVHDGVLYGWAVKGNLAPAGIWRKVGLREKDVLVRFFGSSASTSEDVLTQLDRLCDPNFTIELKRDNRALLLKR